MTTTIDSSLPGRCLVDTNILVRIAQPQTLYPRYHQAMEILLSSGCELFTAFQNIAEYWNVSTRPLEMRGTGLSHTDVEKQVHSFTRQFKIITEDKEVFEQWLALVTAHKVSGRQVHDARLVAHMFVRNIPAILTSNTKDLLRYPKIQLLDPEQIA